MNTNPIHKSKYVSTLLISFLLSLGFLLLLTPLPVYAFTNSFTGIGVTSCTNPCANPLTVTGTIATSNDILVITEQCQTSNNIFSITDTKGGSWASANSKTYPTQNGAGNPDGATNAANSANSIAEVWFSGQETSGAVTATITFTQSNLDCIITLLELNTISIAVNTGSFVIQQFSEPNGSPNSVLSHLTTNYPTVPSNSIVLFFAGMTATNGGPTTNGVSVDPPASTISGSVGNALGQTFVSSSSQVNNGATYNHFCCNGKGNYDSDFFMSVVFAQQGILTGKAASSFNEGCTHAAAITTGEVITGNTTIYYPFWTTAAPETWKNVTVDIKSVALTNGQTSALMFVGIYTSTNAEPFGQGPSNNDNWFLFSSDSVTLTNNATPRNITFNAPASMGGSSTKGIAVGVFVTHNGITLRRASSHTSSMAFDNSTVASGNPNKLQQFNQASANNQACFGMLVSTPSVSQTFTFTTQAASTTITTTSVTTVTIAVATVTQQVVSTIYSLQGGQGGSAILSDILTFSPIIILPLFMGGLFGMIGVFLGLVLGVVIGGQLGIVPQWVIFLLIAAIFYIVVRREV